MRAIDAVDAIRLCARCGTPLHPLAVAWMRFCGARCRTDAWRELHPSYDRDRGPRHRPAPTPDVPSRPLGRPCAAPGCLEDRYQSPGGWVNAYCKRHEAERARLRYAARMAGPLTERI